MKTHRLIWVGLFGWTLLNMQANTAYAEAETETIPQRFDLATGEYSGLSDLAIDPNGRFWSIPERQRVLLLLNIDSDHPSVVLPGIPIEGVDEGLDTEALTWLSSTDFALGTESQVGHRESDDILLGSLQENRAKITGRIKLPYNLWHMRAKANNGIEGLCSTSDLLVTSVETTGTTTEGKRFAPIGRYDRKAQTWTPFKLLLTTYVGKISSLACRPTATDPNMLDVMAIERHFGVLRILQFNLPRQGASQTITPQIVHQFDKWLDATMNLEGLAWSRQGVLYAISDNDFGMITGATHLVIIPQPGANTPVSKPDKKAAP